MTLAVVAALAPVAQAATPTATTAATTPTAPPIQSPSQGAPGSAFGPLQGLGTQTTPDTTVTASKRPGSDTGHGTLVLLSIAALIMIAAVAVFIWWEGRRYNRSVKRRRQRLRAGRGPQALATSAGDARRGPPPPPRKRRQQAKRKKR